MSPVLKLLITWKHLKVMEDDLGVMEDDLGAMEDNLRAMEDNLRVMDVDLEVMGEDLILILGLVFENTCKVFSCPKAAL